MVSVRNYIPGEHLNWTQEEIGWPPEMFDPETTWIVFVDGKMEAMLVGVRVMNCLAILRLLGGSAGWWLRPLWKQVRIACRNLNIAGFWAYMDNGREAERKLIALLREGRGAAAAIMPRKVDGFSISGRF